ncbi:MAG: T9SS type A sorting domain-containing protein [Bacteroidales bacterium]
MLKDIVLEEGSMIHDVMHINDKLIAYSPGKLSVYNSDGSTLEQSFDIPSDGKSYGKFAPVYFRDDTWVPGAKLMAYNPEADVIYVVSANLTIQGFGFDNQGVIYHVGTIVERPGSLNHMKTLHGFGIIKYDESHRRLFWVVQGKNAMNSDGDFHVREVFLGIYKIDSISGRLDYPIHTEINSLNNNPPENYFNAIHDISFLSFNNHYYLARLKRVDVYDIDDTQGQCTVTLIHQHPMALGKIGKLLYINQIGKVLAFPYRLPFANPEPPDSHQVQIYIMDVDDFELDSCNSPDKRIYDAIYLTNHNDLIMCRNPVDDPNYNWIHDQDIAVYHWNGNNFVIATENNLINTNGFPDAEEPNTPIKLLQIDNDSVLISKKHEIVHLFKDGNSYDFVRKKSGLNNIFYYGTKSSNHTFIINLVNNGFERFNSNLQYIDSIRTASPVYHAVHNGPYDRLFFYHTLNSYNSGLYMYNVISEACFNINYINSSSNRIDKPVGSCLFNPYQNHLMVSVNAPAEGGYGEIKCYDAATGYYATSIFLPGNGYCKEMFIAPNGYLYITSDMKKNNPYQPKMFVLRAWDYALLNGPSGQTINIPFPWVDFKYFTANFCFNPYNDKVYATVKPQDDMPMPYATASGSRDSLTFGADPQSQPNGCLLTLTSEIIAQDNSTFINPGKIICRTPLTGNADNESGYVFILSNGKFTILDCDNVSFTHNQVNYPDMTYSPLYDELYTTKLSPGLNSGDFFRIMRLSFSGTTVTTNELLPDHHGYTGAIFMNNFDNMLYVYHKMDNKMLGDLSTRLIRINPETTNYTTIELGDHNFYNFYPEVLQQSQTPVINPYNNTMYIPNGAHSTVSKVEFTANEALYLRPGYNWMSVPRYYRNPPHTQWEAISTVFDAGNFTNGYTDLILDHLHVDYSGSNPYRATNHQPTQTWTYVPDIDDSKRTFSARGYVLDLSQPETANILMMHGKVESLHTTTELYCLEENWIGYYIYEDQNVFDALGQTKDELYHIKHQDYECWRYNYPIPTSCREKSVADFQPGTWICNGRPVIRYGEMIKVKPATDISNFKWDYTGSSPFDDNRPQVEFYQYQKQADYTTFVIELDTTGSNPQEIGAFVNNTCVGACSIIEQDSVVVLSAYLGNNPGDSVVFEEYYGGTKQSGTKKITDYYVMDQRKHYGQRRIITTGEGQDVYIISFLKDTGKQTAQNDELLLNVYPNPATGRIFIEYAIVAVSAVNVEVFDCLGRKTELVSGKVHYPGKYQVVWDGAGDGGFSAGRGLYLVKVSTPQSAQSRKVVMQ